LERLLLTAVVGLTMTTASSQSTTTVTVVPGDTMLVQGSDIECGVPTTVPVAIVCAVVGHGAVRTNSYAVRSAQSTEEILRATGDHRVLFRATNPAISGAPFGTTDRKALTFTLAKHEYVVLEGTNIVCQSGLAGKSNTETFGCGSYSTASRSSGYYIAGNLRHHDQCAERGHPSGWQGWRRVTRRLRKATLTQGHPRLHLSSSTKTAPYAGLSPGYPKVKS
jgi:hypothetical protein